jgi:uncharacterized membrane protein required for colicin V production
MFSLLAFIDNLIIIGLLSFGLIGYLNGLVKDILKKSAMIFAFIIAFTFFNFFLNLIEQQEWLLLFLENYIYRNFFSNQGTFNLVPTVSNHRELIKDALQLANIPVAFLDIFFVFAIFATEAIGIALANAVTDILVYIGTFLFIFISSFITIRLLLLRFYKNVASFGGLGFIDQLAGALFGVFKVILFVLICFFPVIALSLVLPFLQGSINQIFVESGNENSILFFLYQQTLKIIEFKFDFLAYLQYIFDSLVFLLN